MSLEDLIVTLVIIAGVTGFVLGLVAYLILLERKVAGWIQDRVGPTRVGPWGLLQPIADGGKMFLKEDAIPAFVNVAAYLSAPFIAFSTALFALAVVPLGPSSPAMAPVSSINEYFSAETDYAPVDIAIAPSLDVSILFIFAIGSVSVYSIILAGWGANSKYSLLGAMRSSAQIISYEIPLGMSIVGVLLIVGSMNIETIVKWQADHGWLAFYQPVALIIFIISIFAECNRLPFDLPEAEQELVGGYHTEYSNSMKLGLLLLAEYAHMITVSYLTAVLFFGGWTLFGIENLLASNIYIDYLFKIGILFAKAASMLILFLLVRWTVPRFRFDQLMHLAWLYVIPLAFINILATAAFVYL